MRDGHLRTCRLNPTTCAPPLPSLPGKKRKPMD
jgi:hypothetical protein